MPQSFPYKGDLVGRVPVPMFYNIRDFSVAIQTANGFERIVEIVKTTLKNLRVNQPSAIGLFCDADKKTPVERFNELTKQLIDISAFSSITHPGRISIGEPRTGIFVFPDNSALGTLETLLLDCARISYPTLLQSAVNYVNSVDVVYSKKWGQSDKSKVMVGCIANVLKPGKANQVSIQDNKWISKETMQLNPLMKLTVFLKDILELC